MRSLPLQDFEDVSVFWQVHSGWFRVVEAIDDDLGVHCCEVHVPLHVVSSVYVIREVPLHIGSGVLVSFRHCGGLHELPSHVKRGGHTQVLLLHSLSPVQTPPESNGQDTVPVLQVGLFLQLLVDCEYVFVPE